MTTPIYNTIAVVGLGLIDPRLFAQPSQIISPNASSPMIVTQLSVKQPNALALVIKLLILQLKLLQKRTW